MDLDHGSLRSEPSGLRREGLRSVRTTQALVDSMPFATALGIKLDAAGADEVRGRMDWAADRCTIGGALHGGALMTLADSVGAVCAFLNLPEGASTSTIESKTNFFRGVRDREVDRDEPPRARRTDDDRRPDRHPRCRRQARRARHPDPSRARLKEPR